jgi:hypothetical protein
MLCSEKPEIYLESGLITGSCTKEKNPCTSFLEILESFPSQLCKWKAFPYTLGHRSKVFVGHNVLETFKQSMFFKLFPTAYFKYCKMHHHILM